MNPFLESLGHCASIGQDRLKDSQQECELARKQSADLKEELEMSPGRPGPD